MATTDVTQLGGLSREPGAAEPDNYLTHDRSFMSWACTLDHKRIGILYLVSILTMFLVAGIFGMLIRTEHLTPGPTITDADTYNQWFTIHGAIMVFLVIIPGIPAALSNFILPLLIGAKDVAFPRLNLFSYYLYLTGAIFMLIVLATGGLDTGWTFYTPYSTQTSTNVIAATFGVFLLGFSSIFTGLNFLVTIHKMRAPSMTWYKMPLFLWAIYATGISQVLATPVIGITMLLLIFERVAGIGIFDPALGGDPVLFQHFFWFYSHPAVYIMILPAMGVISEIIPVFSRKHIFGYKFIAFSSVAIALFGFLVWGHHMFTSGQSELVNVIFSALTFTVSIPSAIKIFNWLMTMYRGSISFKTPMLYALSFIFIFTIGGLTGLFLGALAASVHLHDTYFVVAHFHYVMMGSAMFGFFAGIHYWWPKMTGRMYNEFWGLMAWLCIFIGFNGAFLPQFVMGSQGMPRRYFNYIEQFQGMHVSSTFFSYIMGIGFVIMAVYLAYSLFRGKIAPKNPWGGATLEWTTSSPPIHENFKEIPYAGDPYDYSDLEYDEENDCYVKKEPSVATAG